MARIRRSEVGETLRCLKRLRGSTVVVSVMNTGPIDFSDLEMLVQDVALVAEHGITMVLVDRPDGALWQVALPNSIVAIEATDHQHLHDLTDKHRAARMVIVSQFERLVTMNGRHLDAITFSEARALVEKNFFASEEMQSVAAMAVQACPRSIHRVHIVKAGGGVLLDELLTDLGAGTMIYNKDQQHRLVRPMKAEDRFEAASLLRDAFPGDALRFVERHIEELRVYTIDGDVHGIARIFEQEGVGVVHVPTLSQRPILVEVVEALCEATLDELNERNTVEVAVVVDDWAAFQAMVPTFMERDFGEKPLTFGGTTRTAWCKRVA